VAPLPGEPAPMKAEARVPHPADLLALQVPSQWILEAVTATSRDHAQGTAGSVAQCKLQPSGKEESEDEPTLGGLWRGTDETGQQGGHTRPCGANQSAPERKATSAAHPDELDPGTNSAAVATTQRQEEACGEAGTEKLPEQGSPVEVQQTLQQEEAGREAGDEELPERGSPVEVQQTLHQEEAGREAGDEELPERGIPVEAQQTLHQEEAGREAGNEENFWSGGALWRSSRRSIKRRLAGRPGTRNFRSRGALWRSSRRSIKQGIQFQDIRDGSQGSGT
jgi:hypothetical protein